MNVVALKDCPICDCRDLAILQVPGHWEGEALFGRRANHLGLMCCASCDFIFVNPRPNQALLDEFYASHDFTDDAIGAHEQASRKAEIQLAEVRRFKSPRDGARLLDYGCGKGILLQKAMAAGWHAVGYDVALHAVAACRQQGLTVVDALDDIGEVRFHAIVLSHVFEHLPDPSHTLEILKSKLVPDGVLGIEVPNAASLRALLSFPVLTERLGFDERYRAFPIHLSYFAVRTLTLLLQKHGFAIESATTTGLGLDSLIVRENTPEASTSNPPRDQSSRLRSPQRQFVVDQIKRAFFRFMMGENLLMVARMRATRGV